MTHTVERGVYRLWKRRHPDVDLAETVRVAEDRLENEWREPHRVTIVSAGDTGKDASLRSRPARNAGLGPATPADPA